jgi:hypothetical protein
MWKWIPIGIIWINNLRIQFSLPLSETRCVSWSQKKMAAEGYRNIPEDGCWWIPKHTPIIIIICVTMSLFRCFQRYEICVRISSLEKLGEFHWASQILRRNLTLFWLCASANNFEDYCFAVESPISPINLLSTEHGDAMHLDVRVISTCVWTVLTSEWSCQIEIG